MRDWYEVADREAVGEALSEEELQLLSEPPDAKSLAEAQLYRSLKDLGEPGPLVVEDLERVQAALHRRRRRPSPVVRVAVFAVLSCAAAAALAWVVRPATFGVLPAETGDARVVSGSLAYDTAEVSRGGLLLLGRWGVAKNEACVHTPGLDACVDRSTRLAYAEGELRVADGNGRLQGSGRVRSGGAQFDALAARFTLEAGGSETSIFVVDGEVVVTAAEGLSRVGPGERWPPPTLAQADPPGVVERTVPDPADVPTSPRPERVRTPAELLDRARRHVAAGRIDAALRAYAELRRDHPRTSAARAANVSIGELQLQRGRSKAALRAFSRYLESGGGPLAEEALWGQVRVFHKLKRSGDEEAAVRRLSKRFPKSVYLDLASRL
ncbi:MAG: tetratricopeptide repeat protein [Nannocystales bacterium]